MLPEGDFRVLGVVPLLAEDDMDVRKVHDPEREQVLVGLVSQREALHLAVPGLVGAAGRCTTLGSRAVAFRFSAFSTLELMKL